MTKYLGPNKNPYMANNVFDDAFSGKWNKPSKPSKPTPSQIISNTITNVQANKPKEPTIDLGSGGVSISSSYTGGFQSGGGGGKNSHNPYKGKYEALLAKQESAAAQNRRLVRDKTQLLESVMPVMNEDMVSAAQQAYLSFMEKRRSMPHLHAAQGLSGGAVDRTTTMLQEGYNNTAKAFDDSFRTVRSEMDSDITKMQRRQSLSETGSAQSYRQKLAQLIHKQQQEWETLLNSL